MNIDSKVVQIDTFLDAVVAGKIIQICTSPHPVNSEKHFSDELVRCAKNWQRLSNCAIFSVQMIQIVHLLLLHSASNFGLCY
jgi:hypothetical protein